MQRVVTLNPVPPFDLEQTLSFLQTFHADGVSKQLGEGVLEQALQVQKQPVYVRLESVGSVEEPELRVSFADDISDDLAEQTLEQVRFYLGLDDDLTPLYDIAHKDDAFQPVLEQLYGFHPVKFPSLFACVCWVLVTQRTPNPFAYKTMRKLTELLGDAVEVGGVRYTTFPEPHKLLEKGAPVKVLEATNNTRKTERLLPLARDFLAADEAFLRAAPYDEAYRWLKKLPGLGEWSVDYIMLRGLGRTERSPWSDTRLLEAISNVYTGGLSISRGDARKLAESYGWYQGWWVHYLKTVLYAPTAGERTP